MYYGNIYDITTNYNNNPYIELINWVLESVKITSRLNKNEFVDIERIRLLIARIIYTIKTNKHNILLIIKS